MRACRTLSKSRFLPPSLLSKPVLIIAIIQTITTPHYNGTLLHAAKKVTEFYVSKKSDFIGGRNSIVTQASVLGGGSSINFMMYIRASACDYDDWNTERWGFDDLKPLFKKVTTPKRVLRIDGNI